MSKLSKELMQVAGIRPKLKLGIKQTGGGVLSTGPHRVKFIADKVIQGKDRRTGKDCEYVRYLFEENGEQKIYETRKIGKDGQLSYFVQHFADITEGDEVILTMKKAGAINYIEVMPVKDTTEVEVEEDEGMEELDEAIT